MNRKGVIAVNQILILIVGIVAIGYEMGVVSGEEEYSAPSVGDKKIGGIGDFSSKKDNVDAPNFLDEGISSALTSTFNPTPAGTSSLGNFEFRKVSGESRTTYSFSGDPLTNNAGVSSNKVATDGTNWFVEGEKVTNPNTINSLNKMKADGTLTTTSGTMNTFLGNLPIGGLGASLYQGASWALYAGAISGLIGGMFLPDDKGNLKQSVTVAVTAGAFVAGFVKEYEFFKGKWVGQNSEWVGVGVAVAIFYLMYEKESTKTITYTCSAWDAPVGGNKCEECNKQGILPCSEYQCKSLGQSCELINPGTAEEGCVWVNRHDVSFPTIDPWEDALSDGYKYIPDNSISPPDRGVKIVPDGNNNGCVEAFLPLSFGVELNEPAACKIDYLRKQNFSQMEFNFGGSNLLRYNHTQVMSLPGPNSEENVTLRNDGNYELYVRCQDANGNVNTANFLFKYCVEPGPDTTPPLIISTDILNDFPIGFNKTKTDLEVYINEPAECRWSHDDKDFKDMEEDMTCSSRISEMNAQNVYTCNTVLTGLKDRQENDFYFRCKDQPSKPDKERNTNVQSYAFTLIGTQPLILNSVGPNGTVKDATESVKVTLTAKTTAGYKEGLSVCGYSETEDGEYIDFFDTNSYEHSQDLYLGEGTYEYWIKCTDLGGNSDKKSVEFTVDSDSEAPNVVRTYYEENYLKLVTNEKADCVYGTTTCNYLFEDGIAMTSVSEGVTHYTDWNTKTTLYIKCKDEFGNEPIPSACSMIIRAYSSA